MQTPSPARAHALRLSLAHWERQAADAYDAYAKARAERNIETIRARLNAGQPVRVRKLADGGRAFLELELAADAKAEEMGLPAPVWGVTYVDLAPALIEVLLAAVEEADWEYWDSASIYCETDAMAAFAERAFYAKMEALSKRLVAALKTH